MGVPAASANYICVGIRPTCAKALHHALRLCAGSSRRSQTCGQIFLHASGAGHVTLLQGVTRGQCLEMSFVVDGRLGQYVNVGYPRVHGSMLTWSAGEEKIQREPLP